MTHRERERGRERERDSVHIHMSTNIQAGEEQKERGREKVLSRLHAVSVESNLGFDPTNCEIMT